MPADTQQRPGDEFSSRTWFGGVRGEGLRSLRPVDSAGKHGLLRLRISSHKRLEPLRLIA